MNKRVFYYEEGERVYLPFNSYLLIRFNQDIKEYKLIEFFKRGNIDFTYMCPYLIISTKKLPNKIYWYE